MEREGAEGILGGGAIRFSSSRFSKGVFITASIIIEFHCSKSSYLKMMQMQESLESKGLFQGDMVCK